MAKKERLNEEGPLNNNLGSSVLQTNDELTKFHKQPLLKNSNNQTDKTNKK
ncbi:hypothetical protein B4064_3144 [Caldibacillus thermoamylovorans]|jgi:hypothetical protein|uniref:hypothetical protein n=1 Tax=Bacillaceae TaxID=186817 RepID=UPI0005B70A38|nr:hypothetical protein [Caldibacillus thermoamylovorans]KIO63614.1 hypothetical protein B4064_3144 [Caldibacillus thermoamylovorans]MCM3800305.1 hypothetical protein [Caldibacillus thermoamylovorans]